jgi:hypothetical protein
MLSECNADTCVIIRTREDGKTFYFITDTFENFLPICKELVRICYSSFPTKSAAYNIETTLSTAD